MFRSSRYANSGIGWFSPVESSAGVANPPISPRTAMNIASWTIDSTTATPAMPEKSFTPTSCSQSKFETQAVAARSASDRTASEYAAAAGTPGSWPGTGGIGVAGRFDGSWGVAAGAVVVGTARGGAGAAGGAGGRLTGGGVSGTSRGAGAAGSPARGGSG